MGKSGRCLGLETYHFRVPTVLKSGSSNFLEPPGSVQACYAIALPLLCLLLSSSLTSRQVSRKLKDFDPLTPNDPYRGRTAPLTSKRCILYIYSTNIGTEYFKRGIYSPFFPL